jgi:Domain of unknown function (DUF4326)
MPLKVDLSQFSLKKSRSYSRFDNGQEEKLRSSLDHRFAVDCFVRALETAIEEQYQRSAAIYLPTSDAKLIKPRAVRLHHRRGIKFVSPNGLPVKCVDRKSRWGNPFEIGREGTREEVIQKYRDWFWTGSFS